jgi:Skp family chaperone for outer membrane proteins
MRATTRLVIAALALLALAWAGPAAPQEEATPEGTAPELATPELVALVVDFSAVVRQSAAAKGIQQQIDTLREAFQEEFGRIETELRAEEQRLTEERSTLATEQFVQRRRAFEQRVTEAQRRAQGRRAALDGALSTAMGRVREELLGVVAEIAAEKGATLVLDKSQVVLSARDLDVTEDALGRLDARLPSVEVIMPPE